MKITKVTSVSGGQTSAYLVANYPTDYNVFALVRTDDNKCKFPDEAIRKRVEDEIQKPFIGTLEDDMIIYTIFDLEQFIGKKIQWVSGITFDEVVRIGGGWLPNKLHRYCTSRLKMEPIFYWWAETIGEPCIFNIGYRASEKRRVLKSNEKVNGNGFLEMKATFEKHPNGDNKWEIIEWQKPNFPLYNDGIYKDAITQYWLDKPVRFAKLNNCVGCFHRNPLLLRKMFQTHPNKMAWFENQEGENSLGKQKGYWRSDMSYKKIRESTLQIELSFDDFSECDSGFCEV